MPDVSAAYELAVYADKALRAGDLPKARQLMAKAADLDGGYAIRAAHMGEEDDRRLSVSRTMVRLVVRPLVEAGCTIQPDGKWQATSFLVRDSLPRHMSIFLGRVKFGKALGVDAARWTHPEHVERFDFSSVGLPRGAISYTTQAELEKVCAHWRDLLLDVVLPWGEGR